MTYIRKVHVSKFRLFDDETFTFSPHFNLFIGKNAQGKTSLLEALYFLITARSFRARFLSDLVQDEAEYFSIQAEFIKHEIVQNLHISSDGQTKQIFYNHTKLTKTSSLLGLLQGVVMTPDDHFLIRGTPHYRRQYLDMQLAQSNPLYVHHLFRYQRGLKQRNSLLKAKRETGISAFEKELSRSAAFITEERFQKKEKLEKEACFIYQNLAKEKNSLQIDYVTKALKKKENQSLQTFFLEEYEKQRPKEKEIGQTLVGPQKDDLIFKIENKEARYFASEGEMRSLSTALRLAEWKTLKDSSSCTPLFFIDDLGLSLDEKRKNQLLNLLESMGQIFITSTEIPKNLPLEKTQIFYLEKGKIKQKPK